MNPRETFNLSAYLVLGPENTGQHRVEDVIRSAVRAGFTFLQIRSKTASARELILLTARAADILKDLGKENEVALVVNDRLDVVLAAKEAKIKVDGIHIGQSDIPADICRKYLGDQAIIGLTAPSGVGPEYLSSLPEGLIDYLGAGPLRPTETKPDCGLLPSGEVETKTLEDLTLLAETSPLPIVVGGGVKANDLAGLRRTGVDGFFVVSAVTQAQDPYQAARELVSAWESGNK